MFDSLSVHHLRTCAFEVVDFYGTRTIDLLEELVLGGTWRRHDVLDLSEKQLETKTKDICVIRW